jgi:hypothetical protein
MTSLEQDRVYQNMSSLAPWWLYKKKFVSIELFQDILIIFNIFIKNLII